MILVLYLFFCFLKLTVQNHGLFDHQKNIKLIRGCEGQCPNEICKSAGLYDAIATPNNLEYLTEILNRNCIDSAYVAGWIDHCGDYVVQCNGAVTPFDVNTNNTAYALCFAKREECKEVERPCEPRPIKRLANKLRHIKPPINICRVPVMREAPRCVVPRREKKAINPKVLCKIVQKLCCESSKKDRRPIIKKVLARIPSPCRPIVPCPPAPCRPVIPCKQLVCEPRRCNKAITPVFPRRDLCAPKMHCPKLDKKKICRKLLSLLCQHYDNDCVQARPKPRRFTCQEILCALIRILPHAYCDRNVLEQLLSNIGNRYGSDGATESEVKEILNNILPVLRNYVSGNASGFADESNLFGKREVSYDDDDTE